MHMLVFVLRCLIYVVISVAVAEALGEVGKWLLWPFTSPEAWDRYMNARNR